MGINSLVLAFPLAPWTGDAPKKIEQYAKDRNLPYSTRPVGASGLRFLFVDFDDMTSVAAKCAEHLLLDVFKIGQGTKVRVRIDPIADPEQD